MSLPYSTPSAAVYLSMGVLPAAGQPDLETLALFGQFVVCIDEAQHVRPVVKNTLTFYDINFGGWGGLVRGMCITYNLPDPCSTCSIPGGQTGEEVNAS